jgi:hypothetical protein
MFLSVIILNIHSFLEERVVSNKLLKLMWACAVFVGLNVAIGNYGIAAFLAMVIIITFGNQIIMAIDDVDEM